MKKPEKMDNLVDFVARAREMAERRGLVAPDTGPSPECLPVVRRSILARLPPMYATEGLDDVRVRERCRDVAAIDRINLMASTWGASTPLLTVFGPAGAGKSTLACATGVQVCDAMERVGLYVEAAELCHEAREYRLGGGEAPLLARALRTAMLIIDEVGAEPSAGSDGIVARVVSERHRNQKRTIAVTPFGVDEIVKRYGDGVARRMFEESVALVVEVRA